MADLSGFKEAYRRRAARAIREAAPDLRNDLRTAAPSRSGNMASEIRADPKGANIVEVLVGVDYASFTRPPGTRPHPIFGKPFLAFFWPNAPGGAADVVFRKVNHPGYQPSEDWYGDVIDTWPVRVEAALATIPL